MFALGTMHVDYSKVVYLMDASYVMQHIHALRMTLLLNIELSYMYKKYVEMTSLLLYMHTVLLPPTQIPSALL